MHIYMCLGQHLNGRLICFQTGYIFQVKVCLRTLNEAVHLFFFFFFNLKLSGFRSSLVHVLETTLVVFQLSYCIF